MAQYIYNPQQGRLVCAGLERFCLALRSSPAAVARLKLPIAPLHRSATFHTLTRLPQRFDDNVKPPERPVKPPGSGQNQGIGETLTSLRLERLLEESKVDAKSTLNVHYIPAQHTGSIKVIALNRLKARNAISRQLLKELGEEIEAIYQEAHAGGTRVLILASNVDSAFCAGADLAERKTMTQDEVKEFLTQLRHTFTRISALPIPTIACVSGFALGGGLELALCTHLRVFSSNATVGLPETSLAIIPGGGGTYRLPQVLGLGKARELILTARRLTGREALSIGLCNGYVESDDAAIQSNPELTRKLALWESVRLALDISKNGPVALRAAIQAMKDGGSEAAENAAYETILQTKDRVEALTAFAEKRTPNFTGQ